MRVSFEKRIIYSHICIIRYSIIIKTSSTAPSEKNIFFYNLLLQPHKYMRHGKLKNTALGRNERLTALLNPSNCPVSNDLLIYTEISRGNEG